MRFNSNTLIKSTQTHVKVVFGSETIEINQPNLHWEKNHHFSLVLAFFVHCRPSEDVVTVSWEQFWVGSGLHGLWSSLESIIKKSQME